MFTYNAALVQPGCTVNNGSIAITTSGGSGNYSYLWSNSQTTSSINGLGAGVYAVTITDNAYSNCNRDTSYTLNSNSTLVVSLANPVNPTCAGNDGSIQATISGGTPPYTVTVDTGGIPQSFSLPIPITNQSVPNVPAGSVVLTVVDAQGCTATANATLIAPANCCTFNVTALIAQPACAQADGSIALTPSNGSGNHSYTWGGGQTSSSINGLNTGNYFVTITDNAYANCFIDTQFTLSNPNGPVIDSFKLLFVSCTGNGADGSVSVYVSGVNGVNVTTGFTWSNTTTDTDDTQADLAAGTYLFTVTDLAGCSTPGSVTIGLDPGCCFLQIAATVIPPTCGLNNASVTVNITTPGTLPYTYSIDGVNFQPSNIFNAVASGTYDVIAADANLCRDTFSVIVPVSGNNLLVTATAINSSCFGANDGLVNTTVLGGTAPYNYLWSNGDTNASIGPVAPSAYSVTVTDQSNCSGSALANVTEPPVLSINLGADITGCESIPVTLDAGAGFTSYLWSTNEISQTIVPIIAGLYAVTVTNANGCTASDDILVTLSPAPVIDLGADKLTYEGETVGLFSAIVSGTANGSYNWQPDTLLSCGNCANTVAFAFDTITYTLQYTDPFGCVATDDIRLFVLPVGDVYWPNAFSPSGDGNNDIFLPYGAGIKQVNWKMFNRWGEKVFESNSFFYGWDGTYKGQPMPGGVYVYVATVTMMNDKTRDYKGSVTLIR